MNGPAKESCPSGVELGHSSQINAPVLLGYVSTGLDSIQRKKKVSCSLDGRMGTDVNTLESTVGPKTRARKQAKGGVMIPIHGKGAQDLWR